MTELTAITGASGFIGRAIAHHLVEQDQRVRALIRRPDQDLETLGVELVRGSMEDAESLQQLVEGADAVVHCAGAIRARRSSEFSEVNAEGTRRLVRAAVQSASRPRVLLMSSLAAREPELSAYAQSKRRGEEVLAREAQGLEHLCLRLPAMYGPGDRATFSLFQQLDRGLVGLPARPHLAG